MKYFKRANLYKASNVKFDPELCQGFSYDWWLVVRKVAGKVIFNNYSYSITTCGHQAKLRRLLDDLGIHIDLVCEAPKGLQDLTSAIEWHKQQVEELQALIKKPRTRATTNARRSQEVVKHLNIINELQLICDNREKHELFI